MNVGKIGEVGETVITRGLAAAIEEDKEVSKQVHFAWQSYLQCEWGKLGPEDKELNDNAVKSPGSESDPSTV